jgi:hypothetical protein|tara:strand:- start:69 stop:206 length:138 start_codon:yes stop_codon:yes gene_type:complete
MGLTEGQKKLPPALQKAILAKQAKDAKKPKKPMPKPPMKGKGKKY